MEFGHTCHVSILCIMYVKIIVILGAVQTVSACPEAPRESATTARRRKTAQLSRSQRAPGHRVAEQLDLINLQRLSTPPKRSRGET
jgi:hypothetical protein